MHFKQVNIVTFNAAVNNSSFSQKKLQFLYDIAYVHAKQMLQANQTVEGAQVNSHFSQCHGIAALNVCKTANRNGRKKEKGQSHVA